MLLFESTNYRHAQTCVKLVGLSRFELLTPRLSSVCSNQLSYRPLVFKSAIPSQTACAASLEDAPAQARSPRATAGHHWPAITRSSCQRTGPGPIPSKLDRRARQLRRRLISSRHPAFTGSRNAVKRFARYCQIDLRGLRPPLARLQRDRL
jgi:hypothetical protein